MSGTRVGQIIPWAEVLKGTERARKYCMAVYGMTTEQYLAIVGPKG